MSRTDLDISAIARSLRRMAGDPYDSEGGIEWVHEPIQASVLLDIADALDENATLRQRLADVTESMERVEVRCAKLRKLVRHMHECMSNVDADGNHECFSCKYEGAECEFNQRMAQLGVEVD